MLLRTKHIRVHSIIFSKSNKVAVISFDVHNRNLHLLDGLEKTIWAGSQLHHLRPQLVSLRNLKRGTEKEGQREREREKETKKERERQKSKKQYLKCHGTACFKPNIQ